MSTDVGGQTTGQTGSGLGVDMNLEVVTLPVADVDRAKSFYQSLGWRLDTDLVSGDDFRVVQFTPPHSRVLDPVRQGASRPLRRAPLRPDHPRR